MRCGIPRRFPRLYAAASLKLARAAHTGAAAIGFSAALCRGLIEAELHPPGHSTRPEFSAALCRGLIEALTPTGRRPRRRCPFSAALCRGLIEAVRDVPHQAGARQRFPRLYAAASLKHAVARDLELRPERFSAALCRGLIEASTVRRRPGAAGATFSAALCRGLIEARRRAAPASPRRRVFRGFMPRPH